MRYVFLGPEAPLAADVLERHVTAVAVGDVLQLERWKLPPNASPLDASEPVLERLLHIRIYVIGRALRKVKSVRFVLRTAASDLAGNEAVATRTLRARR